VGGRRRGSCVENGAGDFTEHRNGLSAWRSLSRIMRPGGCYGQGLLIAEPVSFVFAWLGLHRAAKDRSCSISSKRTRKELSIITARSTRFIQLLPE
jgi:hypothetical protein